MSDLTEVQSRAADLVVVGRAASEIARILDVAEEDVDSWRASCAAFIAEVNRRQQDAWAGEIQRLRSLVGRAVDVIAEDLACDNKRIRQAAAMQVLRSVGLFKTNLEPMGPSDTQGVQLKQLRRRQERDLDLKIAAMSLRPA